VLLISASTFHMDRWLKQSAKCASIVFCVFTGALALFSPFYPRNAGDPYQEGIESIYKKDRTFFPYEAIGSGALALRARHALGWISRLADEVTLVAYNTRPDIDSREASILLSLKQGKQQLLLSNGSVLHLKESDQGKGLYSSETPTGLWVKPILLENGAVLVEAGRKLVSKDGLIGEEKGQFILAQEGGVPAQYNPTQQPFALQLKGARCFINDLLIQKYGGREYADRTAKSTLELAAAGPYACFVAVGDYLLYEEGQWKVVGMEQLKGNLPIAHVKSASAKAIEVEIWDEAGFHPLFYKIPVFQPPRLQLKNEAMPSAIRFRNAIQVSCALGKRRVILKQGDWLLKSGTGWRNLRKKEEIEEYLNHRLKGELLVFDGIEKEQGRFLMKGQLFDETRTQVLPFSLPIESEKSQAKTARKRKPILPTTDRRVA
jgi:hypothetical protein